MHYIYLDFWVEIPYLVKILIKTQEQIKATHEAIEFIHEMLYFAQIFYLFITEFCIK